MIPIYKNYINTISIKKINYLIMKQRMSRFSTSLILILAGVTVALCCYNNKQQSKEFEKLKNINVVLHKDLKVALTNASLLELELNNVWEENQIFTSMLGEIEGEPGGSEILSNLWGKHYNRETE